METMDYSYFPPGGHTYSSYMQYAGQRANSYHGSVDASPGMENPLDANNFLAGSFDYSAFDPSLGGAASSGLTPLPSSSGSPSAQQLSMLSNGSVDSGIALDMDDGQPSRRGSSEEKDMLTPAQSRRKAQNRAAQRAFRERKERHVRDLEAKLNLLTTTTSSLQSDNERLKLMLQRAQTENEILRATATSSSPPHLSSAFVDDSNFLPSSRPRKFPSRSDSHRSSVGFPGTDSPRRASGTNLSGDGHLLSASATWDLLQSHPLYLSGAVDIGEVCERLKKMARCDGMGPMFEEGEVRRVIEQVGRSGGDELI